MGSNFYRIVAAQFFSSLADNALMIVTIALLEYQAMPGWWVPLLKFFFTASYVVLAPWIGALADGMPKSRLMAWMNSMKILGLTGLLLGMHPLLAFALVGFGAAGYAPAKYGLITELVATEHLVKANSWIEITVVGSVLLGAVLGGWLISPAMLSLSTSWLADVSFDALPVSLPVTPLAPGLMAVGVIYLTASFINVFIRDSGRRYAKQHLQVGAVIRHFVQDNQKLWCDHEGAISLAATTIFWGAGATMQFVVLKWAVDQLGLPLNQAAYLQATVAVGVVVGASAAGYLIALHQAKHMLWSGVGLGLLLVWVSQIHSLMWAMPLLVLAGALGGMMVVPLNALLQHRGCVLLSAGRSIAVQGFNENISVLTMLAVYALLIRSGLSIDTVMIGFGLAVGALVLMLIRRIQLKNQSAT